MDRCLIRVRWKYHAPNVRLAKTDTGVLENHALADGYAMAANMNLLCPPFFSCLHYIYRLHIWMLSGLFTLCMVFLFGCMYITRCSLIISISSVGSPCMNPFRALFGFS